MASTPQAGKGRSSAPGAPGAGGRKPWYTHITLDVVLLILAKSVFHPWISLVFYLCLAAVHKHREPVAHYTLYYTAFLAAVEMALWLNHRITYGPHREVVWEEEVAIITGGGRGLGRVLAEMLLRKGAKVAVLDIRDPDPEAQESMDRWDLVWHTVDAGDARKVKTAVEEIVDEFGCPTILINNAASGIIGLPLVGSRGESATLTSEQAVQTLHTNIASHFVTLSTLLPYLTSSARGAHIVTLSSILSHLAPAKLADYAASKSAVSSLHHTLRHELRHHPDPRVVSRVKTLLVETGQLETELFAGRTSLPFYAHFVGPVLDAKDVAKEIVRTIERGEGGLIRLPFYAKCMAWYGVLPGTVQLWMRWFSGIDGAISGTKIQ